MAAVTRSYRIRAYLNPAQQRMFLEWTGAAKWLWNQSLHIRSTAWREEKRRVTSIDVDKLLTQYRKTRPWLQATPSTCMTQVLRDQDAAFRNFFAKRAKYPKPWKRPRMSLRFQDISAVKWASGVLSLPKLGALKLAENFPGLPRPSTVTLIRDPCGRWHVSFCAEVDTKPLPETGRVIGVDLGVSVLATLSSGEKIENPKKLASRLRYLRQQQRALCRKQKGSKRREKQRLRVARCHAAVRNQRSYAMHQITTRLVREFDVIAIEDLNVRGMLANKKLARHVSDAAFREFRRQLEYKCQWYGRQLVVADRWFPSSKTCSVCGAIQESMPLSVRHWTCGCGAAHDRDVNAAQNILLAAAMRQLGPRDGGDLRADAGGTAKGVMPAAVPASEARTGQLMCVEHVS